MAVREALGQAEGGAHSQRRLVAVQGEPQGYRLCGRKRNKSRGGADARKRAETNSTGVNFALAGTRPVSTIRTPGGLVKTLGAGAREDAHKPRKCLDNGNHPVRTTALGNGHSPPRPPKCAVWYR